jgi:membrane fusion protein, multidrug efflux system
MNAAALWLAVGLALLGPACSRVPEVPPARAETPVASAPVVVETVRTDAVDAMVEAVGTVQSRKQMVLSAKILASAVAVHRREGDHVRAGEILVELDDRDARAQRERADAGLREALDAVEEAQSAIQAAERAIDAASAQQQLTEGTLGRYRTLVDRGLVALQEYEEVSARAKAAAAELARARETKLALLARRRQAAARIDQAEAELTRARVALTYTKITAPADGVIVSKTVEVGTVASPGAPLLTLDDQQYRLEASVPESDIAKVRTGQRVIAVVDVLGGDVAASVTEIIPAADPQSRTFTVRIDLPRDDRLRSGLYGRARFAGGQRPAILISRRAVSERGQLERVFVVDPANVARLRLVTTGKPSGDRVEILSGLGEGERVVVEGAERLTDGHPVEVRG